MEDKMAEDREEKRQRWKIEQDNKYGDHTISFGNGIGNSYLS